jgi:hypothetical protein
LREAGKLVAFSFSSGDKMKASPIGEERSSLIFVSPKKQSRPRNPTDAGIQIDLGEMQAENPIMLVHSMHFIPVLLGPNRVV